MREVWLLRHAKSSWDDPTLADEARPLAPRGRRDVATIATYLSSLEAPRTVLCSAGLRARQTLAAILPSLDPDLEIRVERGLYTFEADVVLRRLRRLEDRVDSVLVVGHNPALEELALELSAPGEFRDRLHRKFPTGALVAIRFPDGPWSELGHGSGTIVRFVVPRDLTSDRRTG